MVYLPSKSLYLMEDFTTVSNGDHNFIARHDSLTSSPALLPLSPDKQYLASAGDETSVIATTTPTGNGVSHEILSLESFKKRPEVLHFFPCYEVATDGKLTPRLVSQSIYIKYASKISSIL